MALTMQHGFNNAAILNGGWKKWSKEARPISFQDCTYMPGHFSTTQRRDAFVDKQDVLDSIHDEDVHIINAQYMRVQVSLSLDARVG